MKNYVVSQKIKNYIKRSILDLFKYLFCHESSIPVGSGFNLFGWKHLTCLAVLVMIGRVLCRCYKTCNKEKRVLLQRWLCFGMLIIEFVREFILITIGKFTVNNLPLHLCDWTMFLSVYHSFKPSKLTADMLPCLGMPGAAAALLLCDWTAYPFLNFICITSFASHFLMVVIVIMQLCVGEIKVKLSNMKYTLAFITIVLVPTYIFNKIFHTNFWFVNGEIINSPLNFLINIFGDPGFLIAAFVLVLSVMYMMHGAFNVKQNKMREVLENVG